MMMRLVLGVGLLAVHVGQLLEPGAEVVKVVELEVAIARARVQRGQGASGVAVSLISVMPQIIERRGIWIAIYSILCKELSMKLTFFLFTLHEKLFQPFF